MKSYGHLITDKDIVAYILGNWDDENTQFFKKILSEDTDMTSRYMGIKNIMEWNNLHSYEDYSQFMDKVRERPPSTQNTQKVINNRYRLPLILFTLLLSLLIGAFLYSHFWKKESDVMHYAKIELERIRPISASEDKYELIFENKYPEALSAIQKEEGKVPISEWSDENLFLYSLLAIVAKQPSIEYAEKLTHINNRESIIQKALILRYLILKEQTSPEQTQQFLEEHISQMKQPDPKLYQQFVLPQE